MNKSPNYDQGRIAVDPVIFTIRNQELFVYLHKREIEPFKNLLELPGGLLFENETAENTLKRKLIDIFGKNKIFFKQFFTFSDPKRDPRVRTISIGYVALLSENKIKFPENLHPLNSLPKLAFDHKNIILEASKYLKNNWDPQIARQFLPENFPLNDLQLVYEVITEKKYDNRNFRRKILSQGIIEKVGSQASVNHRPGALFRFL